MSKLSSTQVNFVIQSIVNSTLNSNVKPKGQVIPALLLEGEPGVGKTYISEVLYKLYIGKYNNIYDIDSISLDSNYLFYQCNSQTNPNHLLNSLSVTKTIEYQSKAINSNCGNIELNSKDISNPGILIQALRMSHHSKVVLVLDELDKCSSDVDTLLLEFLQSFKISDPIYGNEEGNKENIIVVATTNKTRMFTEALYRRFLSIELDYPDDTTMFNIINKMWNNSIDELVIKHTIMLADIVRSNGDIVIKPTISEINRFIEFLPYLKGHPESTYLNIVYSILIPDNADIESFIKSKHNELFLKTLKLLMK